MTLPRPILELNKNILSTTFHQKIKSPDMEVKVGYRFMRNDSRSSILLKTVSLHGKKIIHNYGHGRAGVTLSWGCALKVLNLLSSFETLRKK